MAADADSARRSLSERQPVTLKHQSPEGLPRGSFVAPQAFDFSNLEIRANTQDRGLAAQSGTGAAGGARADSGTRVRPGNGDRGPHPRRAGAATRRLAGVGDEGASSFAGRPGLEIRAKNAYFPLPGVARETRFILLGERAS